MKHYSTYQSQFIEMFKDSPKSAISDFCKVEKGTTITRNEVIEGNIPVVAGGQEPSCYHNVANRKAGVITISASGAYSGFVNYWTTQIFASDCNTIIPIDEKNTNVHFLYHGLKAIQKEIYSLQKGGAQPHVYGKDIEKFLFPYPTKEEQDKFADIAQQADKSKFSSLKSQFIEMFSAMTTTPVKTYVDDSFPGEWGTEDTIGDGVKVIRTTNFTNYGKLNLADVVTRSIEDRKVSRKQIKKYDTILERSGGTADNPVGRVVLFEEDNLFLCNNFTQVLRFKDIDPRFAFYSLYYFYQTNKTAIRSMGSKTTGIQNLNMSKYLEIGIPNASDEEQKEFVAIAEQADKSKLILLQRMESINFIN